MTFNKEKESEEILDPRTNSVQRLYARKTRILFLPSKMGVTILFFADAVVNVNGNY